MVKHILLMINLTVLLLLASCSNECIDPEKLDSYTDDVIQWISPQLDTVLTFTDSVGIEESIVVSDYSEQSSDVIMTDNCGHSYGSFDREIHYRASISDIRFNVTSTGYSYGEDRGFQLKFAYSKSGVWEYRTALYDFDQPQRRIHCERLDSIVVRELIYYDVMEIQFDDLVEESDIETFYYSKEYGLVKVVSAGKVTQHIK